MTKSKIQVIFFGYVKSQGITEHFCNMALAINRYTDLTVVYDKRIESSSQYLDKLKDNNIKYIDFLELRKAITTDYKKIPFLFHCQGFSHLRIAVKIARPVDKIMISNHGFRRTLWYGKWLTLLTYFLFFRSVDMWHFLCHKSRDEYFWYKKIPSNTCVFPLGVEEVFMKKTAEPSVVKDLEGEEITGLAERVNIVYVAQFQPWKRHLFLLQSLRSILKGNIYLILVGEGRLLKKIIDLAEELRIRENVIFTGRVDRKTVQYILSHANLAVTVSPSETFGWCLLEPFCKDIPIVSTNVGIADSIINDFDNGFILNPDCKKEEFLKKTKMALKYLGKVDNSGKKRQYLWETFGKTTAKCYDSIFEEDGQ